MKGAWLTLLTIFVEKVVADDYELPSYISVCYRNDPKVNECLKKEIQKLLPMFKTGAKEFDLGPIDPIEFKDMVFKYNNFLIGGQTSIPKAEVFGLTKMKVVDVRAKLDDPKKFLVDIDVHMDKMRIKGGYKLNGNVQFISVNMKGNVDMDLDDVSLTYHLAGTVGPRIGNITGSNNITESDDRAGSDESRDFLHLDYFRWRLRGKGVGDVKSLNDDIVHDSPTLNRIVIALEPAWRILNNAMLPTLLPEADKNLKRIFSKFFAKYPYDVIFPEKPPAVIVDKLNFDVN